MIFIHQSNYIEVKGLWNLCVAIQNVHRLVLDYVTCHTKKRPTQTPSLVLPKKLEKKQQNGNLSEKTSRVAIDWWTVGVFLFELMAGHPPFEL